MLETLKETPEQLDIASITDKVQESHEHFFLNVR